MTSWPAWNLPSWKDTQSTEPQSDGGVICRKPIKTSRAKTLLHFKRCRHLVNLRSRLGRRGDFSVPESRRWKDPRPSNCFRRVVEKLGLNEGVTDRRQRVTFHTLRHTFASWLAMDGINPFHLKELLGHSDLKLTEHYSHLSESALKQAAIRIQNGWLKTFFSSKNNSSFLIPINGISYDMDS